MNIPFSLFLGLHFIFKYPKKGIISLISIISTISLVPGTAVLIIGLSTLNGFEYELNNRILHVIPQGEIEFINTSIINWKNIILKIKKIQGVYSAAPYINFIGLIENQEKLKIIKIKGIDTELEKYDNSFYKFVNKNILNEFMMKKNQIILGSGIANFFNLHIGDWLKITTTYQKNDKLMHLQTLYLQICGTFEINTILDNTLAIIPLIDAQKYLQLKGINGIALKFHNPFEANKLIIKAGEATQSNVYLRHWMNTYFYMYKDIQMIRIIIYLSMSLVIMIACFNIISIIMIIIKERYKDIAILCTLGATDRLIRSVFIWYGIITSMIGNIIGVVIGTLISYNLTTLMYSIEKIIKKTFFSKEIYFINFLPSKIYWIDIIMILVFSLFLSILVSWYPAKRATNINPIYLLHKK